MLHDVPHAADIALATCVLIAAWIIVDMLLHG